jgi:uncharacterized membrane protein YkoI
MTYRTLVITLTVLGVLLGGVVAEAFVASGLPVVSAAPVLQDDDDDEGEDESPIPPNGVRLTPAQARAAAEAAFPGRTVREVELERENGRLFYEVELDNGLEVMVDPNTGAILGTEQDDDD